MSLARRTLLGAAARGLVLAHVAGAARWLTPAVAAEAGAVPASLTSGEAMLLGAFATSLVPDAERLGVVPFIDHHVTVPASDSLLTLRYLDMAPPYLDFYRRGLAALAGLVHGHGVEDWPSLGEDQQRQVIAALQHGTADPWSGPPAPLFYFAVRSDAIDVVYGTEAGFDRLGVPYLAHIAPTAPW